MTGSVAMNRGWVSSPKPGRKPQTVHVRLSSPVFAFATMPWKCAAGLADTIAIAMAA